MVDSATVQLFMCGVGSTKTSIAHGLTLSSRKGSHTPRANGVAPTMASGFGAQAGLVGVVVCVVVVDTLGLDALLVNGCVRWFGSSYE